MTEASEAQKDEVVGEIRKNALTIVKVMRRVFRGTRLVDIRAFYLDSGAAVETWEPSPKGVALQLHQIPQLVALLQRAIGDGGAEGESEEDAEA